MSAAVLSVAYSIDDVGYWLNAEEMQSVSRTQKTGALIKFYEL